MREIKLRGWDGKNKRMVYWTLNDLLVRFNETGYTQDDRPSPFFEWMQNTGLKDKNDNEIWGGDIVKYYDSFGMWLTKRIIHTGLAFAVETSENPILLDEFSRDYIYDDSPTPEIEVIGNIYENYELISNTTN